MSSYPYSLRIQQDQTATTFMVQSVKDKTASIHVIGGGELVLRAHAIRLLTNKNNKHSVDDLVANLEKATLNNNVQRKEVLELTKRLDGINSLIYRMYNKIYPTPRL